MKIYGGITGGTVLALWLAVAGTPAWGQDEGASDGEGAEPEAEQQADEQQGQQEGEQQGQPEGEEQDPQDGDDQGSDEAAADQAEGEDEPQTDTERAREALQQQEGDASQEKNLEEVFQASEDQYSLLQSGNMSLDFSTSYSYFRDDRIDINFDDSGNINRFRIQNDAQHSLSSSLSFDYGIWDNLTFNTRFPVQYKFDTENDTSQAALGDISLGLRYQPFPAERGAMNTTLYTTFSTATGKSPYEINTNTEVSSGKGYYSLGGGLSMSKVVDPVVLFGSMGYTHAFDATGLNQSRGSRILEEVRPGDSLNFSYGLAYSLSYEVSLSASYQQSYNFDTTFGFHNGDTANSEDSTTSTVNMSLGLRSANNRVINVSFGFGLTEDSPDVNMGFSLPIDMTGFKSRNDSAGGAAGGGGGQAGGGGGL